MALLTDLPNEVLLMIWYAADVRDVYNFSTVPKQVYSLVKGLLPKHFDILHGLATINNGDNKKSNYFAHILKEVLLDP